MNIHSYTIVHYGADYLGYALRSIYDLVDRMHVIYTPHPSHGYQVDVSPIESKEQIQQSIPAEIFDKVHYVEMTGYYEEGKQRDAALKICREAGADVVLVVDCDEVWSHETLKQALDFVLVGNGMHRDYLVNMTHLWRSFNWCCLDQNWPVRIIDLASQNKEVCYVPGHFGEIFHFGYAVRDEIMRYKWKIHGHKDELRSGWLDNEWQWWPPQENIHPTNERNDEGVGFWNPELFDKRELPLFMRWHPFYGLDRIE